MAVGKKIFNLYTDMIDLVNGTTVHEVEIEPMTDEEAGQLFRWILEYVNDKHPVVPKGIKYAVAQVKKQLDNDLLKWQEKCKTNRANGALGGRPKKTDNNPKNPDGYLETQNNPEKPDKDKDKDKDIYIDKSINDKSCTHACEEKINLFPESQKERQVLKEALHQKNLDYTEFILMHKLIKPLYFSQVFQTGDCIVLGNLLDEMDAKYDKSLVARAWMYSYAKSKKSDNPAAYITSILEKNINNLINKNENKTTDFKEIINGKANRNR